MGTLFIGNVSYDYRDLFHAKLLAGAQAAFSGDKFIFTWHVRGRNKQRLLQAVLFYRLGKLIKFVFVEVVARLVAVRLNSV
jgi:hypothetical protein